jgi:CRISPR system Cascade subunit CasD
MSDNDKWMVLQLAGPMMSWRLAGRKSTKVTYDHPTFSAIVGLIASALGVERSDRTRIADIASALRMKSFNASIPGDGALLEDFQTVGCRREEDDLAKPLTAEVDKKGKSTGSRKQIITRRHYLTDARYLVMLRGSAENIGRYWDAIRRPKNPLFLGSHCCLFSSRIDLGIYDSEEEAMDAVSGEIKSLGLTTVPFEADVDDVCEANNSLPDYPLEFGRPTGGYGRRLVVTGIM